MTNYCLSKSIKIISPHGLRNAVSIQKNVPSFDQDDVRREFRTLRDVGDGFPASRVKAGAVPRAHDFLTVVRHRATHMRAKILVRLEHSRKVGHQDFFALRHERAGTPDRYVTEFSEAYLWHAMVFWGDRMST